MPPSLSELKVIASFCFAFKIPDDVTATTIYYAYKFEKLSYRNTVSILVFQAKVVNFQETKLLACLIEENATRCL